MISSFKLIQIESNQVIGRLSKLSGKARGGGGAFGWWRNRIQYIFIRDQMDVMIFQHVSRSLENADEIRSD